MDAATWTTVKREFARVQEAAVEERPSLLAALNADLRREVESLMAALEAAPPLLGADQGGAFQPGAMVGPYRLLAELGRGGMGTVYRAERADGELARQRALKVAGDRIFAPEAQRRFIQEREILAGLDHPNIVRLVDGGVAAGRRYFVMELAEGTAITTYCAEHRLPIAERVGLFRQVCAAMHYAHQRLVLHRDIKPSNVIVLPTGQVKVLDFGIAQIVQAGTLTADTRTVMHPLSLACASPEQLRGEPLALTSDIYSLGTLLYEVLTGRNPQYREDVSLEEVMRLVLEQEPPPPSRAARGVPRDLDAVTLKALAKDAGARYQSVSELDADLGRWLDGRPVTAVPPRPWYVFTRWVRRHQIAAATAALAVVGIVGALGLAAAQYRQAELARADAEARFAQVRRLANSLIFQLDDVVRTKSTTEARQLIVADALQYPRPPRVVLVVGSDLAAGAGTRLPARGRDTGGAERRQPGQPCRRARQRAQGAGDPGRTRAGGKRPDRAGGRARRRREHQSPAVHARLEGRGTRLHEGGAGGRRTETRRESHRRGAPCARGGAVLPGRAARARRDAPLLRSRGA